MLDLDESDSDHRDALRTYLEKINFVLPNFKQRHNIITTMEQLKTHDGHMGKFACV
jgi:hypothetical protein